MFISFVFATFEFNSENNPIYYYMKSDIEIARETSLKKVEEIAAGIGVPVDQIDNYGKYIAKLPLS